MKILVEISQVVLEHQDCSTEKYRLDQVAKAHRLTPHSVCEPMRPHFFFHDSGMIEPMQNFWVITTVKGVFEQQLVTS